MDVAALQIVGGGQMGEALLAGLLRAGFEGDLRVVEPLEVRCAELSQRYREVECTTEVGPALGSVIAVKPAIVPDVARRIGAVGGGRVLSIAAGVTVAAIESELPPGTAVVRAMPNTPALVGCGAAAIAAGSAAGDDDLAWAEQVLGAVGVVVRVPERLLDAVTGLSGSGPAYVFLVLEALIEGGVAAGLPRDVAETLAGHTLHGSARLYLDGDETPATLRAAVTSPGGTTAAGLGVLEQRATRSALIDAVAAATARATELGTAGR